MVYPLPFYNSTWNFYYLPYTFYYLFIVVHSLKSIYRLVLYDKNTISEVLHSCFDGHDWSFFSMKENADFSGKLAERGLRAAWQRPDKESRWVFLGEDKGQISFLNEEYCFVQSFKWTQSVKCEKNNHPKLIYAKNRYDVIGAKFS